MTAHKLKSRMKSIQSVYKITTAMKSISAIYLKKIQKELMMIKSKTDALQDYIKPVLKSYGFNIEKDIVKTLFSNNIHNISKDILFKKHFNISKSDKLDSLEVYLNELPCKNLKVKNNLQNQTLENLMNLNFPEVKIAMSAEGGLCGSFFSKFCKSFESELTDNMTAKTIEKEIDKNVLIITDSEKFSDFFTRKFKKTNIVVVKKNFQKISLLLSMIYKINGANVKCSYMYFVNNMKSIYKSYNPFDLICINEKNDAKSTNHGDKKHLEKFIKTSEGALKKYILIYIENELELAQKNNRTSEYSAKLLAMDSASSNADDLYNEISLKYFNARQSSITEELIEVISASEALEL